MDMPRLENGVLYIGDSILTMHGSSLDTLIYYFGYPENCHYLMADTRIVVFQFEHDLGKLFAFVFFQQPDWPIIFEPENYDLFTDRGNLIELHFEFDENQLTRRFGKVKHRLKNGGFDFVVFKHNVIGRKISHNMISALSFVNSLIITEPEKSFMFRLYFRFETQLMLRPVLDQVRQEEAEKKQKVIQQLEKLKVPSLN